MDFLPQSPTPKPAQFRPDGGCTARAAAAPRAFGPRRFGKRKLIRIPIFWHTEDEWEPRPARITVLKP